MSSDCAFAFADAARAAFRSFATRGSRDAVSTSKTTVTASPGPAFPPSRIALFTIIEWPPLPSGSADVRKANPLIVPAMGTVPRDGSFALTCFGKSSDTHAAD